MKVGAAHVRGLYTYPSGKVLKKCSVCKQRLALTEFGKNNYLKGGINSKCLKCSRRLWSEYRAKNKEKLAEYHKRFRAEHPERVRERKLRANSKPRSRFLAAVRSAAKRGLLWTISEGFFLKHLEELCSYCAGPLPRTGHGFDRVDNSVGYSEDNVVACCWRCNLIRGTELHHAEMVALGPELRRIREMRALKREEW